MAASIFVLALAAVGCGDVKKCKKGTEGCLDGTPFKTGSEKGKCSFGLVPEGNKCVESDGTTPSGNDAGTDGGGGRDSGTDAGRDSGGGGGDDCDCASDQVCSPDDGTTCLSYCDAEPTLTAVSPPPGCRDYTGSTVKPLPFATACKNACLQYCMRAEIFCPGFVCDPKSCDDTFQTTVCVTECPGNNVTCITAACEEVRDTSCSAFECPAGYTNNCTDVRCSDSCSGSNNKDGYCDDGDPYSASYDYCAYGTDCADCGPRKGPKPAVAPLGGNCVRDVGCAGFDADFLKTESWCLNVPGTDATQFACIPNCTGEESDPNACPSGYKCQGIEYQDGTAFEDPNGLQAFGCVPQVCQ